MALAPRCKTWGPYLANKILHGILTAPVESLCEISITDVVSPLRYPNPYVVRRRLTQFSGSPTSDLDIWPYMDLPSLLLESSLPHWLVSSTTGKVGNGPW